MASDTDALQFFHRVTNILERYVICEIRRANAWSENEPEFSAFEFLVESYCVENLLARKIPRQPRGQPKSDDEINNCEALIRPQPRSLYRDAASGNNSKAHGFSMQEFPVSSGTLDRVSHRVTEIQKRTLARPVTLIFRDDSRFDLDVALDQPL